MKREPVIDFFIVHPRQMPIHIRLTDDWPAYCHGSSGSSSSPMFRLYRSDEYQDKDVPTAKPRGDAKAGAILNAAVMRLPEPHRIALQWFYIAGGSPLRPRRVIGCTMAGLQQYLQDARNMLVNRGT